MNSENVSIFIEANSNLSIESDSSSEEEPPSSIRQRSVDGESPTFSAENGPGNFADNVDVPMPINTKFYFLGKLQSLWILTALFGLSLFPVVIYIAKFCTFGLGECCEEWGWSRAASKNVCSFWQSVGIVADQNCFYWPTTFCAMCLLALGHEFVLRFVAKAGSTCIAFERGPVGQPSRSNPSIDMEVIWQSSNYMLFYAIIPLAMGINSIDGQCFNTDACQDVYYVTTRIFFIAVSIFLSFLLCFLLPIISCICQYFCTKQWLKLVLVVKWQPHFHDDNERRRIMQNYYKYYSYVREFVVLFFFFTVPGNLINQLNETNYERHHYTLIN